MGAVVKFSGNVSRSVEPVQTILETAILFFPYLLPVLATVFAGGIFACGRRGGGFWLVLLALGGMISGPVFYGIEQNAVPLETALGFLSFLTVASIGALTIPLIRGAAFHRGRSGPSNRERIVSALYAVSGTLLMNVLSFTIMWFQFLQYPDCDPAVTFSIMGALIASPVGALLGRWWGEHRISRVASAVRNG